MVPINLDTQAILALLKPVLLFVLSIVIYSIFIFKFYRFLAKRDILSLNLSKYNNTEHWFFEKFFAIIIYLVEFILILPICIFVWYGFLVTLLSLLAKNQTIETILLVGIGVVGAVRVISYYNEDLSKDLAKMLPFALLGVFLVDISFFDINTTFDLMIQVPNHLNTLLYYLLFISSLELVLRIFTLLLGNNYKGEETKRI